MAAINTPEITRRLFQIIPGLSELQYPRQPSIDPVFPFALPSWCVGRDLGCPHSQGQ